VVGDESPGTGQTLFSLLCYYQVTHSFLLSFFSFTLFPYCSKRQRWQSTYSYVQDEHGVMSERTKMLTTEWKQDIEYGDTDLVGKLTLHGGRLLSSLIWDVMVEWSYYL
jgi:hypothetical protein